MYLCLGGGVANLLSGEPRRRRDPELTLDLLLVTYTMGAIAYVFVTAGLLGAHAPLPALLTSIAWAGGGIALIWMILREMLERERYPSPRRRPPVWGSPSSPRSTLRTRGSHSTTISPTPTGWTSGGSWGSS